MLEKKNSLSTWPNALYRIVSYRIILSKWRCFSRKIVFELVIELFSKWKSSNLLFVLSSTHTRTKMRKNWGHAKIRHRQQLLWPSACLATVNFLFVWSVFFHNSRTPLFTQFPGKFPTFRLIIRKALLFYLPMLLLIFFEFFFFIRRIVCYIIRVNRYISKLNVNVSLENTLAQCSFTNDLKIRFSTCDMVYEA